MSIVVQMPAANEQRERRLHLREVREEVAAPSIGSILRDRRIERGFDEAVVSAKFKMRSDILRALERDDFSRLPARPYAVGFVRAYSKFLGLNSEDMVERYKRESDALDINKPTELVFPEVNVERQWPNGGVLVVALVFAVLVYGIAHITMPTRQAALNAAQASSSVEVVEAQTPTLGTRAPSKAVSVIEPKAVVSPVALPLAALPVFGDEAAVSAWLLRPLATPAFVVQAASESATQSSSESLPAASRITLKALEATYVQVKDPALRRPNAILLARVMNPGESFQAPDRSGLVLLTGNAGGIQVEVDGRSTGILGKSGQVIKRLPLEPAYFLSRLNTSQ